MDGSPRPWKHVMWLSRENLAVSFLAGEVETPGVTAESDNTICQNLIKHKPGNFTTVLYLVLLSLFRPTRPVVNLSSVICQVLFASKTISQTHASAI